MTLKTRKRDQIWAGYSEEAASDIRSSRVYDADPVLNKLFNWTIFLSRKATIHKKFVHIYRKAQDEAHLQPEMDSLLKNKSKDFCWMISNCGKTFSWNRFKIANSIIQSLSRKFHIWGNAINDKNGCINSSHTNLVNHGLVPGVGSVYYDEPQKYIRDCKFYFAFENSNCSDYVTEKFMNAIEVGAIPIVVGWWDTYRELLPGSFIHVNEFANASLLAEYLESLLKDEKKMKKYHEWRKYYKYERTGAKASCELCEKLKQLKLSRLAGKPLNPSIILDMGAEFRSLQKCES